MRSDAFLLNEMGHRRGTRLHGGRDDARISLHKCGETAWAPAICAAVREGVVGIVVNFDEQAIGRAGGHRRAGHRTTGRGVAYRRRIGERLEDAKVSDDGDGGDIQSV